MSEPRWSDEETLDTLYADTRGFFKVEEWTADDLHVALLIYAGNNLDRARQLFDSATELDPGGRYLIRQGIRIVDRWPR